MGKTQAKNTAWKWFSKYIRLRDCLRTTGTKLYGLCISCNKPKLFEQSQAGHFVSGRKDSVLFEERAVHLQCVRCNKYLNGNYEAQEENIIKLYGESAPDDLRALKHKIVKYTEHDYRDIATKYRLKYKELLNG